MKTLDRLVERVYAELPAREIGAAPQMKQFTARKPYAMDLALVKGSFVWLLRADEIRLKAKFKEKAMTASQQ